MKKSLLSITLLLSTFTLFGENIVLQEDFENPNTKLNIVGRGNVRIENGVLKTKDAYAVFGDSTLRNYRATFRARASAVLSHRTVETRSVSEIEPQIWAGFRHHSRLDRYVVGLKGGLQNNIEVFRMGYMGADELIDIQPLDFKPKTGEWYDFTIEVVNDGVGILINDNYILFQHRFKNDEFAPNGGITLGGGWIETEFDNLKIEKISELSDWYGEELLSSTGWTKENKRQEQLAKYQPKKINELPSGRQEFSLNGDWQFAPNPEKDTVFHIMPVPNFWNPIRIWLHGETMNDGKFPKGVSDKYYWQETARCENYTFDYRDTHSALYRQIVELPQGIETRVSELVFDAVSKTADVYVNGAKVASHVGMFGEIRVDVSKHLHAGGNTIDVLVTRDLDTPIANRREQEYYSIARIGEGSNSSDDVGRDVSRYVSTLKDIAHGFYQGDPAGIWQPVRLVVSNKIKIEDVFIKPALTGADFEVEIKNNFPKDKTFNLKTLIVDKQTGEILAGKEEKKKIKAGVTQLHSYTITQLAPKLWSPAEPNLYDFHFIIDKDTFTVVSGFRTFESKNGLLHLNGKPYWLRGGNHTPFALAPNDTALADTFYRLMKAGNMQITRTHTTPYNELWLAEADKIGIGISHEGTYPWLMIHETMPDTAVIRLWADEYISLLKKYRNHPSILFWTVNNEMKFYDNEPDMEKRKMKMHIIERVVRRMREIDPTRPICFDSNYRRSEEIFGKEFYGSTSLTDRKFDDGDIDDVHAYINWYDHTIFKQFNGEFQRDNRNEGRPLISQEMSTGYPNNETGHATRFYNLVHQNPQTLVGYLSYPFADPARFLQTQAFITGELAEALRRSNDKASGILHFALLTWFRNVYDSKNIEPYPTYYAMKRAMQPVLVSAELWGRHFYAGGKIPAQIYIVNDSENGKDLPPTVLEWFIENENGEILVSGKNDIPAVKYYGRYHFSPQINIPANIQGKINTKLKLCLKDENKIVSENEYDIIIAGKEWVQAGEGFARPDAQSNISTALNNHKKIVLIENNTQISTALDFLNVKYTVSGRANPAPAPADADVVIISGADFKSVQTEEIREYIRAGGKVILQDCAAEKIFPEYITGAITPTEGDIVNMEIPESLVFNGIDELELRYFNNEKREIPTVCRAAYQIARPVETRHASSLQSLASQTKIHGYIEGDMQQRTDYVKTIKGFPLLEIKEGKGRAIISSMSLEKAVTDPIAGRLLMNLINE